MARKLRFACACALRIAEPSTQETTLLQREIARRVQGGALSAAGAGWSTTLARRPA